MTQAEVLIEKVKDHRGKDSDVKRSNNGSS